MALFRIFILIVFSGLCRQAQVLSNAVFYSGVNDQKCYQIYMDNIGNKYHV